MSGDDSTKPQCPECGKTLACSSCEDTRPTAEDLDVGWRFVSPVGRWETVTHVDQPARFGPVVVTTDRTGRGYSYRLVRWEKLTAVPPQRPQHGEPEIRIVEYNWATGPIWAVPTLSTVNVLRASGLTVLVEAGFAGKGEGWKVTHYPAGGTEQIVIACESKAKARSTLIKLAREHAKALGVKVVIPQQKGR